MGAIAEAVRHMLAAGMPAETIVSAIEDMESATLAAPARTARQARNARYYVARKERQASESVLKRLNSDGVLKRLKASESVLIQTHEIPPEVSPEVSPKSIYQPPSYPLPTPPIFVETPKIAPSVDEVDLLGEPLRVKRKNGIDRELILDAVEMWNNMAAECGLTQVRDITDERQTAVRRAVGQFREMEITDPQEGFRIVVGCVRRDEGMCGRNKSGWKATFDWMLKKANITRLAEQALGNRR